MGLTFLSSGLAWRAIHPKEYMLLFVVALLSIPPGSICSSEIRRKALGRAVVLSKQSSTAGTLPIKETCPKSTERAVHREARYSVYDQTNGY